MGNKLRNELPSDYAEQPSETEPNSQSGRNHILLRELTKEVRQV